MASGPAIIKDLHDHLVKKSTKLIKKHQEYSIAGAMSKDIKDLIMYGSPPPFYSLFLQVLGWTPGNTD
jgi:hypothetical protein